METQNQKNHQENYDPIASVIIWGIRIGGLVLIILAAYTCNGLNW